MHHISAFILTRNSEKYLEKIILQLSLACDEIIILDSGSTDSTKSISEKYRCRFFVRAFDNFRNQRAFALEQCRNNLVLMVDSDEIPDDELIAALNNLRQKEKLYDAYRLNRLWCVLGQEVHAVYPVVSPDHPVRLFDKRVCNFENSPVVHEEPSGYSNVFALDGALLHYTFETKEEIAQKLEHYATLSSQTLIQKKKSLSPIQQWMSSIAAFFKWYFIKGGWRDGGVGITLGKYAFDYTFLKYKKARKEIQRIK